MKKCKLSSNALDLCAEGNKANQPLQVCYTAKALKWRYNCLQIWHPWKWESQVFIYVIELLHSVIKRQSLKIKQNKHAVLITHKHMSFVLPTSRLMEKSVLYLLYGPSTVKVRIGLDIQKGDLLLNRIWPAMRSSYAMHLFTPVWRNSEHRTHEQNSMASWELLGWDEQRGLGDPG